MRDHEHTNYPGSRTPGRCESCGETFEVCASLRATNRAKDAARTFPKLSALLRSGIVRVEGREYVGTAADGVVVSVGTVGDETNAERYLTNNPSPEDW